MDYRSKDDGYAVVEEYNASVSRKISFAVISFLILLVLMCAACAVGSRTIDVISIPGIIFDHLNGVTYDFGTKAWWDDYIIWDVRLPRVIIACVAGASLAICGAAVQSLMNNPLASPYTLGISSGACFGAVLAIVSGFSFSSSIGTYGITSNAFIFGMLPVAVVLIISKSIRMTPVTLILVGVAISQFFGSLSTLVMMNADEGSLQAAYLWQVGTLNNAVWTDLPLMFIFLMIGSILLMIFSWKFNVLTLGDDSAKTLGVDANKFRITTMIVLALMTMSVVSYTGIIGFVGMIAPHMVRFVVGGDNKFVLPTSMIVGAIILLIADTISRMVVIESIPVGAVMSFIGGPIFIYLVIKRNSLFKGGF